MNLFLLGQTVATPGALAALSAANADGKLFLYRHARGDWGTVCKADAKENDRAVCTGERILSAYKLPRTDVTLWIITEADRSVTTLLLPEEY